MPESNRKIYDIFPPKEKPSEIRFEESSVVQEKEKEEAPKREKITRPRGRFRYFFKGSLILILLLIVAAGLLGFFFFSNAEVGIWPETNMLTFEEKITIDTKVKEANFETKIIPGKIFETEKDDIRQFSSTGKAVKEEKARGKIKIYNAYSSSSQILVADTRFISADGKVFKLEKRTVVPAATYDKGKLVAAFIDADVVAAEAGPDYNIEPSTFSIPGFLGTPKYTAFYGKSSSAMSGGMRSDVAQITQEDLTSAKNNLADILFKETRRELENMAAKEGLTLLVDSESIEIKEAKSLAKVGDLAENFSYQVKVGSKVMAFNKSDLEKFAQGFISPKVPTGKKIQEKSFKVNWLPQSVDLQGGKAVLNLEFGAKIFTDIDILAIQKALRGKSAKESEILLKNYPQITQAKVKLWPFWAKKIPQKEEKIKIELILDPVRNLQ